MAKKKRQLKNKSQNVARSVQSGAGKTAGAAKKAGSYTKNKITSTTSTSLAFLSVPDLLKWSEGLTKSSANVYDKAMDAEYLRTHIGGGNHRMFDDGHDLVSAWGAVKDASSKDSFQQEVTGYMSSVWKDLTTERGLPFMTWSKDHYDASAEWLSSTVPYASKSWFYDLMSFDVFELLSTSLGVAGMLYALSKDDKEKLSEILGSMGILSIISANPLMGIAVVLCTAHTYAIKKRAVNKRRFMSGAGVAGVSITIFGVLGLPVLIELGIVIVASKYLKKTVFDNDLLLDSMKQRVATLPAARPATGEAYIRLKDSFAKLPMPIRKKPQALES